jgi:hypothetical protein
MANKADSTYMGIVADLGCIVCRNNGYPDSPAECHHIGNKTLGKKASNRDIIPLCPIHHRSGNNGVAVHSGRKSFEKNFGTEQELLNQTLELLCLK